MSNNRSSGFIRPHSGLKNLSAGDNDLSPNRYPVEQFDQVGSFHPDAPEARRRSNFILVARPVDIDVAVAGIGIVLFQAFQPKNAGKYQVIGFQGRLRWRNRHATLKNRIGRKTNANLVSDPKPSKRRPETASLTTDSES